MYTDTISIVTPILIFSIFFLASALKVLKEYERGVVFMLGRFWRVKGPGLVIVIPAIQTMVRVDLRTIVMDVPAQDVISRDNVSVKVNAVLYFRVVDPQKAIIQVEDYNMATSQLAQTTLRSVLGQHELDEMLASRDKLNTDIQLILDEQTEAWGIKVSNVESSTLISMKPWYGRLPGRPKLNVNAVPKSFMQKENCRHHITCLKPRKSWLASHRLYNCAICKP